MTVTYIVEQSSLAAGPWVAVAGSPFVGLTDTITGLTPGTSYYFRLTAQDLTLGVTGTPTVVGPIITTATITESPQGTLLTSTTGTIVDASLASWSLVSSTSSVGAITPGTVTASSVAISWAVPTSALAVRHPNGVQDGSNVVKLLYWNHLVYRQDSTGWANWNGSAWVIVQGDPSVTLSESPQNTTVTDTVGVITDANLTTWRLTTSVSSGLQIVHGGVTDPSSSNVVLLLYWNHIVYQENNAGGWLSWSGSQWTATTDPRQATLTESPQNAQVVDTTAVIVDANLNVWKLVTSASLGFQIAENNNTDPNTSFVVLLLYWNRTVYQENSAGSWYNWNGTAWVIANGDPRVSIVTWSTTDKSQFIVLSNNNLTATSTNGNYQAGRATLGYNAGKRFFEVTLGVPGTPDGFWDGDSSIGIANSAENMNPAADPMFDTTDSNMIRISPYFQVALLAGVEVTPAGPGASDGVGSVLSIAVDLDAKKFWYSSTQMRVDGNAWNNGLLANQNPSTGVGGVSFTTAGPYFPAWNAFFNYVITANFGASAFTVALPTGFSAWGGS